MRRMMVLLTALALLIAACGDDDGTVVAGDSSTTSSADTSGTDQDETTTTEAETTTTTEPRAAYTDGFEVDHETGNVNIDAYAAFLGEHGAPEGGAEEAALELLTGGDSSPDVTPQVSSIAADGGRTVVTVEFEDLGDDSVAAERYEIVFVGGDGEDLIIESGSWASRCQEGRGHQDYEVALCV